MIRKIECTDFILYGISYYRIRLVFKKINFNRIFFVENVGVACHYFISDECYFGCGLLRIWSKNSANLELQRKILDTSSSGGQINDKANRKR